MHAYSEVAVNRTTVSGNQTLCWIMNSNLIMIFKLLTNYKSVLNYALIMTYDVIMNYKSCVNYKLMWIMKSF